LLRLPGGNVEKAFVANVDRSFCSVYFTWIDGAGENGSRPKIRVDYKKVLPLYARFSKEQLAAMVQKKNTTRTAIGAVDGVG
jgi:hypothetical protein